MLTSNIHPTISICNNPRSRLKTLFPHSTLLRPLSARSRVPLPSNGNIIMQAFVIGSGGFTRRSFVTQKAACGAKVHAQTSRHAITMQSSDKPKPGSTVDDVAEAARKEEANRTDTSTAPGATQDTEGVTNIFPNVLPATPQDKAAVSAPQLFVGILVALAVGFLIIPNLPWGTPARMEKEEEARTGITHEMPQNKGPTAVSPPPNVFNE
eukprot:Plantae.Rhodophyta-Hildenbrandia_rubra.ctg10480.p1 GENE.Plantae.Rhodophyta-Hildenbrandia_rubra.ctg10480~~Plantae.Rhodophyta-Hildenbrandia_rubra.ctg10480.p1  ORF type:complete len:210 (-),score=19.48 Plantae.Rhodophyta-Hildenbrandia_rubra.ctg10480:374-1003(-)